MQKVLISGASGFIGYNLCKILKNRFDVTALVRDRSKIKDFEAHEIDLTEPIDNLPTANFLVHLAALIKPEPPISEEDFFKINAMGTFNLLVAAKKVGINNVVYASTVGVYGNKNFNSREEDIATPGNTYSLTKFIGEDICRYFANMFNLKIVILRFSGVYGKGKNKGVIYNSLSKAMAGENFVIDTTENSKWDPVYVKDATNAVVKALDYMERMNKNVEIFNIGCGKAITIKEIIDEIISITESKSKVTFLGKAPDEHFSMDVSKARNILKFEPMSVNEALKDFYEELKCQN